MDTLPSAGSMKAMTKNPLGIIALFIFLIYSIASLVLSVSAGSLSQGQKWVFILFLVVFPLLVLGSFVWLVANHAVKLYSPSDFRDDVSYVQLNHKMQIVEVKQQAAEIDPRGNVQAALRVIPVLASMEQIETAKSVAKAFLKVGRHADGLLLFEEIGRLFKSNMEVQSKLHAYKSYCMMGLGRYSEAQYLLEQLQVESPQQFDFWPGMALAYCLFKQGDASSKKILRKVASDPAASGYLIEVQRRYPELSADFQQFVGCDNE
jgi:hypothetical protein